MTSTAAASSEMSPSPVASSGAASGTYDCDVDAILGVAVFDINGLPKEYFITPENRDTAWVQLVFQSLGLQALITNTLQVSRFNHTVVQTRDGDAIVIQRDRQYIAFLVKRCRPQKQVTVTETWLQWACEFEANTLRQHTHFRAA